MKFETFKFKKVRSTNDTRMKLIKKNKNRGLAIAEAQTNGKGTYGKKWISKKGNFYGSIFFPIKKNYPTFDEFSTINPVIVSNIIKKYCKKKNLSIKFPNDIFLNGKKICGILEELITLRGKKFLIVGIGINTFSNPSINAKYKTTNIFFETKKKLNNDYFKDRLITEYKKFFENLEYYDYINFKKKANSMVLS